MKKVSMILAAMMMASAAVYAQQTQQQTPVPAKPVGTQVAQQGTFTSPASIPVVAPVAAPGANLAIIVLGASVAGIVAVSQSSSTTSH